MKALTSISKGRALHLVLRSILFLLVSTSIASGNGVGVDDYSPGNGAVATHTTAANKVRARDGHAGVVEKIKARGPVPVIVQLNTPFEPLGTLSAAQAETQKMRISQAHANLLRHLSRQAIEDIKAFRYIPYVAMRVDEAALNAILSTDMVASIEEDIPEFPTLTWSTGKIGAPAAWTRGFTGQGQTLAILDTGVDKTHPFLSGKVVSEACYSNTINTAGLQSLCPDGVLSTVADGSAMPYAGSCPSGKCDHGTHVAGIAAGGAGDSSSGVAFHAQVIAIQVFRRYDSESDCSPNSAPCVKSSPSDQIEGLERVFELRNTYDIAAVNMSLGGGKYVDQATCDLEHSSRKAAIDNLRSAGIATIISSGNDGYSDGISAPACISTAVSVGATDSTDAVRSFSNSASFLSLLAPGYQIESSIPGGGYASYSGTSMAAPHVTGAWAILKEAYTPGYVSTILTALSSTGADITDSRNNVTKKRINVDEAASALTGTSCGGIPGDFAPIDCDVDGSDLAVLIEYPGLMHIALFAQSFGSTTGQ